MSHIYILKLKSNKFLIGKTNNLKFKVEDYSSDLEWTINYEPIKVLEIIYDCDEFDEDKYVFKYMSTHGIDNVRGGSFSETNLSNDTLAFLKKMVYKSTNKPNIEHNNKVNDIRTYFNKETSTIIINESDTLDDLYTNNDSTMTNDINTYHVGEIKQSLETSNLYDISESSYTLCSTNQNNMNNKENDTDDSTDTDDSIDTDEDIYDVDDEQNLLNKTNSSGQTFEDIDSDYVFACKLLEDDLQIYEQEQQEQGYQEQLIINSIPNIIVSTANNIVNGVSNVINKLIS